MKIKITLSSLKEAGKVLVLGVNNASLVKKNDDGTITLLVESEKLTKEFRDEIGLFKVRIKPVDDDKILNLLQKFPEAHLQKEIGDDGKIIPNSILFIADKKLQPQVQPIIDGWNLLARIPKILPQSSPRMIKMIFVII